MDKKAVVLSSGGLDSTTAMAIAKNEGYDLYSITFIYGQRHSIEVERAGRVANFFEVKKHIILDMDLNMVQSSSLTYDGDVPKDRDENNLAGEIPTTYVAGRNVIFLSIALSWAETLGTGDIFIGATSVDYSGYPDCRPEFFKAFEDMANLAMKSSVTNKLTFKIHAPLLYLAKSQIIKKGLELGVDYSITNSCYDPDKDGRPCGRCDSCKLRLKGFREIGIADPLTYKAM
ncbi:MAG: 7-cyano-7-deazaguanine synthase QueC [bacterium]